MYVFKKIKVKGFTLAEIMVTMAILTLAFSVIIPFIMFTYKASVTNETKNALMAKVRNSYELMKQDAAKAQFVYGFPSGSSIVLDQYSKRLNAATDSDVFAFISTGTSFDRGVGSSLSQPAPMTDEIYRIVIYSLKAIPGQADFYELYRYEREMDPKAFQSGASGLPMTYSLSAIQNANTLVLDKVSKVYTGSNSGAFFSFIPGKAIGVSYIAYTNIYSKSSSSTQSLPVEGNVPLQAIFTPLL
jgi:prepilin-type N-terminal cleavage/methylation domain-containing protein